jgi:nucleotide-binding universal stress UspA family protein
MERAKILVPVDFSEASRHALRLSVSLLKPESGRLTLLHVGIIPHFYATELGVSESAAPLLAAMSDEVAREQRARLDALAIELIPPGVNHEIVVREGWPPEEILDQVQKGGHDLLVMGTHGRTGLRRALIGSVTERVVRECPIPVLVTHGPLEG